MKWTVSPSRPHVRLRVDINWKQPESPPTSRYHLADFPAAATILNKWSPTPLRS